MFGQAVLPLSGLTPVGRQQDGPCRSSTAATGPVHRYSPACRLGQSGARPACERCDEVFASWVPSPFRSCERLDVCRGQKLASNQVLREHAAGNGVDRAAFALVERRGLMKRNARGAPGPLHRQPVVDQRTIGFACRRTQPDPGPPLSTTGLGALRSS